ncbi:MAG: ATP-binding protein [Gemmatimonadota bacterium]|nr:ATP-binding protein [Gemmatimonadota bacterium]
MGPPGVGEKPPRGGSRREGHQERVQRAALRARRPSCTCSRATRPCRPSGSRPGAISTVPARHRRGRVPAFHLAPGQPVLPPGQGPGCEEKGSIILTSNKHVRDWPEIFAGDEILTTAILDRLLHHVHIIHIDSGS